MHAVGIMQIADFAFIPFGNACLLRPTHLRALALPAAADFCVVVDWPVR
jgi:hypothetical protein